MNNVPAVIDPATGEVMIPIDQRDIVASSSPVEAMLGQLKGDSAMPLHLAMIQKLALNPERFELVMSAYAQVPVPFDEVVKETLLVYGVVIFQHGPYNGKDGLYHPEGYYTVRFLVEREGELCVVQSGSQPLLEVVASIIAHRGGGLFKEPILYSFTKGSDRIHRIYNKTLSLKPELLQRKEP